MSDLRKQLKKQLTHAFLRALRSGSREPLEDLEKRLSKIQQRTQTRQRSLNRNTRTYCTHIGDDFNSQREEALYSCDIRDDAKTIDLKLKKLEQDNASLPLRNRHKRTSSNKHKYRHIEKAKDLTKNIPLKTQGFTKKAFGTIAKDITITTSLTLACVGAAQLSGIFNPLSISDYVATTALTLITTGTYFINRHAQNYVRHSSDGIRSIVKNFKHP